MELQKKLGNHGFIPLTENNYTGQYKTLSVGIFEWVKTADDKGIKPNTIKIRVKGPANKWQKINEAAMNACLKMDDIPNCFGKKKIISI